MKTVSMIALREHVYDGQRYRKGDPYKALPKDVFILEGSGLSEVAKVTQAAERQGPDIQRGYQRRDMKAVK